MSFFQNEFGTGFQLPNHLVFFGGKKFTTDTMTQQYADLLPRRIRQTHSDIIVEASDILQEADAQYTSSAKHALVVATADCIPLMVYCCQTKRVAAIHAGWKGVRSHIAMKAISQLQKSGSSALDFQFYLGPHITQESFETDKDVFELMQASHSTLDPSFFSYLKKEKFHISLRVLIQWQLEQILRKPIKISDVEIDTKTNVEFHSFRRDRSASGRNLSFIAQL